MKTVLFIPINLQALSPAESLAETGSSISDDNFVHGFFAALSVIIVSELGDKTFFIAAILSMKHPRLTVFAGRKSHLKQFCNDQFDYFRSYPLSCNDACDGFLLWLCNHSDTKIYNILCLLRSLCNLWVENASRRLPHVTQ